MKNKKPLIISNFTHYTDQELLASMQEGHEEALTVLYHRYYRSLFLKAYKRIPSVSLVEEIVQDVFVNFWFKAASLDTEGNVGAYLYATLRNKVLHELRTEKTRALYREKIGQLTERQEAGRTLNMIYASETQSKINEVISTLSPQCREAFLLSRHNQLSYQEIAENMGISISTVEKHVSKALRILRSNLQEYRV